MDESFLAALEKEAKVLTNRLDHLRVQKANHRLKFPEWMQFFRVREKLHAIYEKLLHPNDLVVYNIKISGFKFSKKTDLRKLTRALDAKKLLYSIDLDNSTIHFYHKGKLKLPVRTLDVAVVSGTSVKPKMAPIELKTPATLLREAPADFVSDNFRSGGKRKRLGDQINTEKWVKRIAQENKVEKILLEGTNIDSDRPTSHKISPDDLKLSTPKSYVKPSTTLFSRIRETLKKGKKVGRRPRIIGAFGDAKVPKNGKARGKGKGKPPLEPTTYTPGRGTDSATPTAKDRGTNTSTKPKQKSAEIVTVNSKGSTFKMNLSARYPKTIASLKFGGALVFNMILGSIVTRFREKIVRENHGNALAKIFEEERTQIAIENKLTELAHLSERDDKAYYIQVQLSEHWWGRFNSDGSSEGSLETPVWFRLYGISGPIENGNRACKVTSIEQRDNEPDGVEHKFQICAYPLLINPAYKMKLERDKVVAKVAQAHRDKIQRWDTCIGSELGKIKSAGPITPQEQEVAETICTKRWGRRPLTRD